VFAANIADSGRMDESSETTRQGVFPEPTLGERLQMARKHAGISVARLADDLEVSRGVVSKWENDHEIPRRAYRLAYALRCGVNVGWLEFGGTAFATVDDAADYWSKDPDAAIRSRCFPPAA
jgi:transcriptional regulator with XRE-family HTH domain